MKRISLLLLISLFAMCEAVNAQQSNVNLSHNPQKDIEEEAGFFNIRVKGLVDALKAC